MDRPGTRTSRGRRLSGRIPALIAVVALAVSAACAPSAEKALGSPTPEPYPTTTPTVVPTPTPTPTPTPDRQCPAPPQGGGGGDDQKGGEGGSGRLSDTGGNRVEPVGLPVTAPQDKAKPVLDLCFAFSSDRTRANGREGVTFRPDLRTCELVFRLWPNKPDAASSGAELTITKATVGQTEIKPTMTSAGGAKATPGTLASLELPRCVAPGTAVTASLDFSLALGRDSEERVGYDEKADVAWAGTAFPLLAWVPGRGWARDPAVALYGETATSTDMTLRQLVVITNTGDTVLGSGTTGAVKPGATSGTEAHTFAAPDVRDVAVTVGSVAMVETKVGDVTVHLGLPRSGTKSTSRQWSTAITLALRRLQAEFGRFPYRDLWVSVLPDVGGGIEFPGSVQLFDLEPARIAELTTHELAHQWFYGLVGNDQGANPWLDESFATYATAVTLGQGRRYAAFGVPATVRNRVGQSMSWYNALRDPQDYTAGVYYQGAKMLLAARTATGAAKFRALTRDYITANANKIATPASVATAYRTSPQAIALFRQYGAIG